VVATSTEARLLEAQAEIARLREQLARLHAELASSRAEQAAARAELATFREESNAHAHELTAQIGKLTETVAKGNDRIAELLAAALRKKKASSNKKTDTAPAAPPVVDDAARKTFDERPKAPEPPPPVHDRPKPQQRRPGRNPLPAHLERDETTKYPERCSCGCGEFDIVDEHVEEKLHVKSHQRVRRTRRKIGLCKKCGQRVTAEAPPSPFERSKATPEWLGWSMAQLFELVVPIDRLRRSLLAEGVALSKSFLVSQKEAAADLLAPIDGVHWKMLLGGDHLATDGTGFKVQVPGLGLHHGFFEVYHWDDTVVFQYTPEKGGESQAARLTGFAGTLLVDGESRYNETLAVHPKIVEANCNAHPRRKLKDAEAVQPVLAAEAGRFVSAMFEAEELAAERELTGDALLRWRQTVTKPITDDFLVWMDAVEPTLSYGDPVAKVIRYYQNHWDPLMRFLSDPSLPLDNSRSEREFQVVAKLRLNVLFAGGTEGAHRAAVLLGIAATCRRVGVDFEDYMTWVFVRRGTHRYKYDLAAADLTPAAYKRSLKPAPS
jgi:transposase